MGIDVLDLVFRIERAFGVRIKNDDLSKAAMKRRPPDVSAGELLWMVRSQPRCCRCHYDLRGHDASGRCPECGEPFSPEATWEKLRDILAEVIGVEVAEITPDSLIVRDLGMT